MQGVFVEFNGMLFDVVVFGILITIFMRITEKRRDIKHQQEIINDYKKWNSDEARFRIAGAIRRMVRLGNTNIDFGGIELRDFAFRNHDIKSIRGSLFYDGKWGESGSRDKVVLDQVDFSFIDCSRVIFSKLNPLGGLVPGSEFVLIRDCSFIKSDLSGAIFKGAHLEWTTEHPSELVIGHDEGDGYHSFEQTHYPSFWDANLSDASFENATFKNADFRGVEGILQCNFKDAKGLETCIFDDEETKNAVLKMAREKNRSDKAVIG